MWTNIQISYVSRSGWRDIKSLGHFLSPSIRVYGGVGMASCFTKLSLIWGLLVWIFGHTIRILSLGCQSHKGDNVFTRLSSRLHNWVSLMECLQKGYVGVGHTLSWIMSTHIVFCWHGGKGSNNRENLLALWGVLQCTSWLVIEEFVVVGNSKSVIEWEKGLYYFDSHSLHHWKQQIRALSEFFKNITLSHMYREQNMVDDHLSKHDRSIPMGEICFNSFVDGYSCCSRRFKF